MISQIVYPKDKTEYGLFVENSIKFMKEAARAKNKTVKINSVALNRQLYFTKINIVSQYFQNCFDIYGLVDTGAANSLIQQKIAKKLGLVCTPFKCTLSTATGTDDEAITGITHTEFTLETKKGVHMKLCTDFIVSNVLNGLDCILGSELLLGDRVTAIDRHNLFIKHESKTYTVPLVKDSQDGLEMKKSEKVTAILDNRCEKCKNSMNSKNRFKNMSNINNIKVVKIMSHSFKQEFKDETLPSTDELFEDNQELDVDILEKKISLDEGDYSDCPPEWKGKVTQLVEDFEDRFSKTKLDLEITDKYTAELDTMPGKIVNQRVRRLPENKFDFALKALKQLEKAGVISESDSEWRSNVVMIPKPTQKNELRAVTKADMQDKSKDKGTLYRICLDFRELNNILVFPKQVQFTTLDKFLYVLKNKVEK